MEIYEKGLVPVTPAPFISLFSRCLCVPCLLGVTGGMCLRSPYHWVDLRGGKVEGLSGVGVVVFCGGCGGFEVVVFGWMFGRVNV